jgi:hypothetical protein
MSRMQYAQPDCQGTWGIGDSDHTPQSGRRAVALHVQSGSRTYVASQFSFEAGKAKMKATFEAVDLLDE